MGRIETWRLSPYSSHPNSCGTALVIEYILDLGSLLVPASLMQHHTRGLARRVHDESDLRIDNFQEEL